MGTNRLGWTGVARIVSTMTLIAAVLLKFSTSMSAQLSRIEASQFGTLPIGAAVELYTLQNHNGVTAKIATYGGILTSLLVPDRAGKLADVVLGFDSLAPYLQESPYFGALIGRYGNRIAGGHLTLEGRTYELARNNPPNSLHGGKV